jgi:hypothetical protein
MEPTELTELKAKVFFESIQVRLINEQKNLFLVNSVYLMTNPSQSSDLKLPENPLAAVLNMDLASVIKGRGGIQDAVELSKPGLSLVELLKSNYRAETKIPFNLFTLADLVKETKRRMATQTVSGAEAYFYEQLRTWAPEVTSAAFLWSGQAPAQRFAFDQVLDLVKLKKSEFPRADASLSELAKQLPEQEIVKDIIVAKPVNVIADPKFMIGADVDLNDVVFVEHWQVFRGLGRSGWRHILG